MIYHVSLILNLIVSKCYILPVLGLLVFINSLSDSDFVQFNDNLLKEWYPNKFDQYLLQSKEYQNITEKMIQYQSLNLSTNDIDESIFGHNLTYKMREKYHTNQLLQNISFYDRQINIMYQKYLYSYNDRPISKLLSLLSQQNKNLIFVGDSMTEQVYQAFQVEAKRENIILEDFTIDDTKQLELACTNIREISCNNKYEHSRWKYFNFPMKWIPPKSSGLIKPVFMIFLWLSDYETDYNCKCSDHDTKITLMYECEKNFAMTLQNVLPCINSQLFVNGSYIIANQGLRMNSKHYYMFPNYTKQDSYKHFFRYLLDLKKRNTRDVIAYLETFPTHLRCVTIVSWQNLIDDGSSYIAENKISIDILKTNYFYPFMKQKVWHPEPNKLDCLHFSVLIPTTWFPLFNDMFELYINTTLR